MQRDTAGSSKGTAWGPLQLWIIVGCPGHACIKTAEVNTAGGDHVQQEQHSSCPSVRVMFTVMFIVMFTGITW